MTEVKVKLEGGGRAGCRRQWFRDDFGAQETPCNGHEKMP